MADEVYMYRTTRSNEIERREVVRETVNFVVLRFDGFHGKKEIREAKRSEWAHWHKTWNQAHQFVLGERTGRLRAIETQTQRLRDEIAQLESMTNPEDDNG